MTLDLRAICRCNLGRLVTASLSDSYIQESGLIRTTGSCVIDGLIAPALGTVVTFQYTKSGITRTVPRKTRVLSYFADPFRRTTSIELGCKLTLLADKADPIEWTASNNPFGDGFEEGDEEIVVVPIKAKDVAEECTKQLGIGSVSLPLTNAFSIPSFDLSSGYVNVLSDLLVSEGYCGYLDFNENLQLIDLDAQPSGGPLLTRADLVDIGPIGVGTLPGEAVVVSYSTLKLKAPDPVDISGYLDWEYEETNGPRSYVTLEAGRTRLSPNGPLSTLTLAFSWFPRTQTWTEYDLWDRVIKKRTVETAIVAAYNIEPLNQWYQARINLIGLGGFLPGSSGLTKFANTPVEIETETTYTYKVPAPNVFMPEDPEVLEKKDGYEEIELERRVVTMPEAVALNGVSIRYTNREGFVSARKASARQGGGISISSNVSVYLPSTIEPVITEIVETRYETQSRLVSVPGKRAVFLPVTRKTTKTYRSWARTARGQNNISANYANLTTPSGVTIKELDSATTKSASEQIADALKLVYDGEESSFATGREAGMQARPSEVERRLGELADGGDPNFGYQTPSVAEMELAVGSSNAQIRINLSLPYAPDDRFIKVGPVDFDSIQSDAPVKARNYGRIQNRILMGNRNGMNMQVAPERLPREPFAPIFVSINGDTVLYRVNAMSWTLDASGIVASSDSVHWGQAV